MVIVNGGGAMYVHNNTAYTGPRASFTMNYGEISDNEVDASNGTAAIVAFSGATININGGRIHNNKSKQIYGGGVHIGSGGILNMAGGEISDNSASTYGGGVSGSGATLNITGGKIIGNKAGTNGAGIYATGCSITVSNSKISDNSASTYGGGIYLNYASSLSYIAIINNSAISGNTATTNGGGIYAGSYSTLEVNGSTINDNASKASNSTANGGGGIYANTYSKITFENSSTLSDNTTTSYGGGIYGYTSSTIAINSSTISGNKATTNGGGIYIVANSKLEVSSESQITGNNAVRGGGIYTASTDYSNLATDSGIIFSGNRASAAYTPPENAETLYPDIHFEKTSITVHPLNNFDINYIGKSLTFTLTYNANGGAGSYTVTYIEPSSTIEVLSSEETGISRENHYTFIGWNTKEDDSGTGYQPGDDITMLDDTTLYAQWTVNQYTVTFESNGGSRVEPQSVAYRGKATEPEPPTKEGFTFADWYTDDETFENACDFDTNTVTSDMTLYAKWTVIPAPSEPSEPTPFEPLPSEPPISEQESTPGTEKPSEENIPQTGDRNSMAFWISLLFISFSTMVILIWKSIRKERINND